MPRALFPGSFDPVTFGHLDLIERGARIFDSLTVAVATNISKQAVFTLDERVQLVRESLPAGLDVDVVTFDGLVVDYCRTNGYGVLLRGLRSGSDFDYEFQMAQTNGRVAPDVETALLIASPECSFLSSSLIKDVARHGGDVASFVPAPVAAALSERLRA